jgi:hypothetical protein
MNLIQGCLDIKPIVKRFALVENNTESRPDAEPEGFESWDAGGSDYYFAVQGSELASSTETSVPERPAFSVAALSEDSLESLSGSLDS